MQKKLIASSAKINAKGKKGWTTLLKLSTNGNTSSIPVIIGILIVLTGCMVQIPNPKGQKYFTRSNPLMGKARVYVYHHGNVANRPQEVISLDGKEIGRLFFDWNNGSCLLFPTNSNSFCEFLMFEVKPGKYRITARYEREKDFFAKKLKAIGMTLDAKAGSIYYIRVYSGVKDNLTYVNNFHSIKIADPDYAFKWISNCNETMEQEKGYNSKITF